MIVNVTTDAYSRLARSLVAALLLVCLLGSHVVAQPAPTTTKPKPLPAYWRGVIGEYGPDDDIVIILEKGGSLCARFKDSQACEVIREVPAREDFITPGFERNYFEFIGPGLHAQQELTIYRRKAGRATDIRIDTVVLKRRPIEPESGNQLRIKPVRPVSELMKEALAAQPPQEKGDFLQTDLVELRKLDPTIRQEIRYATTNNFLGTKFYSQARAFMQRPAAEALVRAHRNLRRKGYGLLIHDAYRPWYVTKVFWDATPEDKKWFVADPSKGSRHNRGCAVDLTLYYLKTGKPVEMVATYDETTDRAHSDYPGGSSLQRWHRDLLRKAMEAEGFTIYAPEWWHFDYKDWQKYRIGNMRFEEIGTRPRR